MLTSQCTHSESLHRSRLQHHRSIRSTASNFRSSKHLSQHLVILWRDGLFIPLCAVPTDHALSHLVVVGERFCSLFATGRHVVKGDAKYGPPRRIADLGSRYYVYDWHTIAVAALGMAILTPTIAIPALVRPSCALPKLCPAHAGLLSPRQVCATVYEDTKIPLLPMPRCARHPLDLSQRVPWCRSSGSYERLAGRGTW